MGNRRNTIYFLTITSLLGGLFTGRAFFFNVAYLLMGIILIALIWSWLSVRGISISRKTRSRSAQVGSKFEEAFALQNSGWLPKLWVEVRDQSTLPDHRASQVVPTVMPRKTYRWYAETICRTRGEFQLGPISVIGGDPFGMFNTTRRIPATSRVTIYPATVPISRIELPVGVLSGGDAQRRRSAQVTTNAAGIREYVPGDSFNRIHWATTARRDRLMVKEFEIDPLVDIWLFVDFSSASLIEDPTLRRVHGTGAVISESAALPLSTEEYAVVIAASLAQYFIEEKRTLGYAAYIPHRDILQPDGGMRQLMRIMQSLAVARSFSPYNLREMLMLETPYFTRGTTIIIITSSLDASWLAEAHVLSRRGLRPMAILLDPASFGGSGSVDEFRALMKNARIPSMVVRAGDDLSVSLAQRLF